MKHTPVRGQGLPDKKWFAHHAYIPTVTYLDMGMHEIMLYYAAFYVELPRDMTFQISFGVDDFVVMYFNHKEIFSGRGGGILAGARIKTVKGKKGKNLLLMKCYNWGGQGGHSVRLLDMKGNRLDEAKIWLEK